MRATLVHPRIVGRATQFMADIRSYATRTRSTAQRLQRFGAHRAFGTHPFLYFIMTTARLIMPEQPGLAASLLRITGSVVEDSYHLGDAVLAFKAYQKPASMVELVWPEISA